MIPENFPIKASLFLIDSNGKNHIENISTNNKIIQWKIDKKINAEDMIRLEWSDKFT